MRGIRSWIFEDFCLLCGFNIVKVCNFFVFFFLILSIWLAASRMFKFKEIREGSRKVWNAPLFSRMFYNVRECSRNVWNIPEFSRKAWKIDIRKIISSKVLEKSEMFQNVLKYFRIFQKCLKYPRII